MNKLLDEVIAAHGGEALWKEASFLNAKVAVTGGLFASKGHPQSLAHVSVDVSCKEPKLIYRPFSGMDRVGIFQPTCVTIENIEGTLLERRSNPRFHNAIAQTLWDYLSLLYFCGYAMWNYLCAPFFLAWPGFVVSEGEVWEEEGEVWRRLDVTFPGEFPTHSKKQVFYIDEHFLLRRVDYQADILGGIAVAHYMFEPRVFSGLIVPTKRQAYPRELDNRANKERSFVEIAISDVKLE